jgi:beta-glucanase (GH16 family)
VLARHVLHANLVNAKPLPLLLVLAAACSSPSPDGGGASTAPSAEGDASVASGPASSPASADDAGAALPAPIGPSDAGTPSNDASAAPAGDAGSDASPVPVLPGWSLVWSDEFNAADGSGVDTTKWTQETGNDGWSNNHELEYYTPGTDNAVVEGGSLVITAKSDGASAYDCQYGTCQYTSARMNTSGKFSQAYGRFEARIKLPSGQGMWPAFWILGDDIGSVGWPQCGEVDIMENIGSTASTNYGSLHGPGYSGSQDLTGSYTLPGGATLGGGFHVFASEWAPDVVRFYVDGVNYETRTPADVPSGDTWVYDHPFFVILNVAVGGYWPGNPDSTTTFPQSMEVDYVRVYAAEQ